jgi:hypothetical protein
MELREKDERLERLDGKLSRIFIIFSLHEV